MADNEWVDVTHQHLGGAEDEWEDVTNAAPAKPDYKLNPALTPEKRAAITDVLQAGEVFRDPKNIQGAMTNAASVMTGGGLAKSLGKKALGVMGSAAESGAVGAAQSPDDRLAGFLKGAAPTAAIGGIAKGLGKVGDYAMQVAVNRKKYTPGVGTTLADEGLWGTEGMLKKQTGEGLTDAYEDMLRAADDVKTPIDSRQIGNQLYDDYTGPLTGRGTLNPSAADVPNINAAREFADDVRSRGEESVSQALKRRAAAGKRSYSLKTGNERSGPAAEMSKREQQLYSHAAKEADETGRLADADQRYAALKRAERGLEEEASLPKSMIGLMSLGANKVPGGSIAASSVGQLATKARTPLEEFLAPLVRQSLVNQKK